MRRYGASDSFDPDQERVLASMERKAQEGAIGFEFDPSNGLFDAASNQQVSMLFSDPERAYPLFETAREPGIKHIGVPQMQPVGPGALDAARVEDVSTATVAFPDCTFGVVHAGWAFAEECALPLMMHTSIHANLEGTVALVVRQPHHFAHIIGTMREYGRTEQLLNVSGCALSHPDPMLRAFLDFAMPQDLRDGYGYPQITPEMKRKILGGHIAALLGIDTAAVRSRIGDDRWSALRAEGNAAPWSAYRARRTVEARACEAPAARASPERLRELVQEVANESHDPCGLAYGHAIGLAYGHPCGLAYGHAIGVAAMGLIRALDAEETADGWRIALTVRRTAPTCLYDFYFERELRARLERVGGVAHVDIHWDQV